MSPSDLELDASVHTTDGADDLVLRRAALLPGERSDLYVRARRGELVRIASGCWVASPVWDGLDQAARHRLLCRALTSGADERLVFSHQSAAVIWRLPMIDTVPARAHVLTALDSRDRSTTSIVRHKRSSEHFAVDVDGLSATTLVATVVDCAALGGFAAGVVLADAALRRATHPAAGLPPVAITREGLRAEAQRIPRTHGATRVRRVIEFADGAADRPGESLSRVSMLRAGLTPPQLQVPLRGVSGARWVVDFSWPDFSVIGEFDGRAKYSEPEFLRGRSPEQAVYEEKLREDDLRAVPYRVVRWNWRTARSAEALGALLRRAGVR